MFMIERKKRAVKTALFEFCFGLERLHSHSFDVSTHLFKKFIAKFIADFLVRQKKTPVKTGVFEF